jgi:hypothetical protein
MKQYDVRSREEWIEEDCVCTYDENCDACPYVLYGKYGERKCEKTMYEDCMSGEFDEES